MNAGLTRNSWLRRHWLDMALALMGLAASAGLLWLRAELRRGAGGLTLVSVSRTGRTSDRRVAEVSLFPAPADISELRWSGFLWVPHKGKYVLGVQIAGKARLDLDGRKVIERSVVGKAGGFRGSMGPKWAVVRSQVLVDRGWHGIRLTCRPVEKGGCRLLWQAPGRRGSPEYVDSEFLRPGPDRPKKAGPAGIGHRDAWIVTSVGLVWLLIFLVWLRRSLGLFWTSLKASRQTRLALASALGWFALALAVRLFLLGRFGQTWDEDAYTGAGRNYWWNLLALDFREQSWIWNMEHPPVTKYLAGFGALWTDSLWGPRFVFSLLSASSVALAWDVGRRLFGPVAAWVGAALLCLSPHLVAHGTIAGHEAPSIFFLTATMWALLLAEEHGPGRAWPGPDWMPKTTRGGWYLAAGLAAGLAVATRWLGASAPALLLAWFLVTLWAQLRQGPRVLVDVRALAAPVLAGIVVVAIWPWLWHSPLAHLSRTLGHYGGQVSAPEPFLGRVRQAPWYYFPAYLSATLQPVLLLGFAAWLVRALLRRNTSDGFVALWVVVPLGLASLSPLKQDGIRYVLPVLVPMAAASGDGLGWLWGVTVQWVSRLAKASALDRLKNRTVTALSLSLLALGLSGWSFAGVFPYELDYYNSFWGGAAGVCRTDAFETSWWGEGLVPTARWVDAHVPKDASLFLEAGARHVFVVRTDIRIVAVPSQAQFWVRAGRAVRRPVPPGFVLVHREAAAGCALVEVWRRLGGSRL